MKNVELFFTQSTSGTYILRLEDETGVREIELTPEEFAKAVTGKLASGLEK